MPEIGFGTRLAYARWLRDCQRGDGRRETDAEFAKAVGVGVKWLGKWKLINDRAPVRRKEAAVLMRALAPLGATQEWLYDGKGAPPQQKAWKGWLAHSRALPAGPGVKIETRPGFVVAGKGTGKATG